MKSIKIPELTYPKAPHILFWEITRACDFACKHCRANAIPNRHPDELTTEEAKEFLDRISEFDDLILVITGGDPLKRPDLDELIKYSNRLGLRTGIAPSGVKDIRKENLRRLIDCGVRAISLSIDGPTAQKHDSFRKVPGVFDWTLKAAQFSLQEGLPLQVNTTVAGETADGLPEIYELVKDLGVVRWSLFFLVPTGRGKLLKKISPKKCERILNWLYEISEQAPFQVKTTEAHHFRRVKLQRMMGEGISIEEIFGDGNHHAESIRGISDGNGVMFVSHTGEVYPSGFLPLSAGNVRQKDPVWIYRHSKVFVNLRDKGLRKGKCGRCEFKGICGGSRAQAFAATEDYLAADPLCIYQPGSD